MSKTRQLGLLCTLMGLALAACSPSTTAMTSAEPSLTPPAADQEATGLPAGSAAGCELASVSYTSNSSDGNHFIPAASDLNGARRVEIDLGAEILWVVGLGSERGSRWLVSDATGGISEVLVEGGRPQALSVNEPWPERAPLAAARTESGLDLLGERLQPFSPLTSPVRLESGELTVVTQQGDLRLVKDGVSTELPVAPLPDARLLYQGGTKILLYSNPTSRYDHGVLGDRIEAGAITVINTETPEISWSYTASGDSVFEGIAPLWVDLNQDGESEVLVTASDAASGARYALIAEGGELAAESEPIGQGYRWRHAIASAPLGPGGEWELVGVRTPHLGGVVEYFQWRGGELVLTASLEGYSSHRLGSRNLDQALVADVDADGRFELLVPTQDYSALASIARTNGGAIEEWRLELPSRLSSNLAVACHQGEAMALAAGLENGRLLLWLPE